MKRWGIGVVGGALTIGILSGGLMVKGVDGVKDSTDFTKPVTATAAEVTGAKIEGRYIEVSADGSATQTPDKAEITLSVRSDAKTADKAQKKNSEKVNKLMMALGKSGIKDKDIKTSNMDLSTKYDYSSDSEKITGYRMETTIDVSDLAVDKVGEIVSTATSAGATGVDGITFTCSKYNEAYASALDAAYVSAKAKADALAGAANGKVGDAVRLTEGYQDTTYRNDNSDVVTPYVNAPTGNGSSSMEVNPGEADINAQITAVFEIK